MTTSTIPKLSQEIATLAHEIKTTDERKFDEQLRSLGKVVEQFQRIPSTKKEGLALRHQFVQTFSQDEPWFDRVRAVFSDSMYQQVISRRSIIRNSWLSVKEQSDLSGLGNAPQLYHRAAYFHATEQASAEKILSSQKILMTSGSRAGGYSGAFVSTYPANFGDFVFVFNRGIEHAAPVLRTVCGEGEKPYCYIGFARPIPVTEKTLEAIAVRLPISYPKQEAVESLQARFSKLAGREIKVIPLQDLEKFVEQRGSHLGISIPREWNKHSSLGQAADIPPEDEPSFDHFISRTWGAVKTVLSNLGISSAAAGTLHGRLDLAEISNTPAFFEALNTRASPLTAKDAADLDGYLRHLDLDDNPPVHQPYPQTRAKGIFMSTTSATAQRDPIAYRFRDRGSLREYLGRLPLDSTTAEQRSIIAEEAAMTFHGTTQTKASIASGVAIMMEDGLADRCGMDEEIARFVGEQLSKQMPACAERVLIREPRADGPRSKKPPFGLTPMGAREEGAYLGPTKEQVRQAEKSVASYITGGATEFLLPEGLATADQVDAIKRDINEVRQLFSEMKAEKLESARSQSYASCFSNLQTLGAHWKSPFFSKIGVIGGQLHQSYSVTLPALQAASGAASLSAVAPHLAALALSCAVVMSLLCSQDDDESGGNGLQELGMFLAAYLEQISRQLGEIDRKISAVHRDVREIKVMISKLREELYAVAALQGKTLTELQINVFAGFTDLKIAVLEMARESGAVLNDLFFADIETTLADVSEHRVEFGKRLPALNILEHQAMMLRKWILNPPGEERLTGSFYNASSSERQASILKSGKSMGSLLGMLAPFASIAEEDKQHYCNPEFVEKLLLAYQLVRKRLHASHIDYDVDGVILERILQRLEATEKVINIVGESPVLQSLVSNYEAKRRNLQAVLKRVCDDVIEATTEQRQKMLRERAEEDLKLYNAPLYSDTNWYVTASTTLSEHRDSYLTDLEENEKRAAKELDEVLKLPPPPLDLTLSWEKQAEVLPKDHFSWVVMSGIPGSLRTVILPIMSSTLPSAVRLADRLGMSPITWKCLPTEDTVWVERNRLSGHDVRFMDKFQKRGTEQVKGLIPLAIQASCVAASEEPIIRQNIHLNSQDGDFGYAVDNCHEFSHSSGFRCADGYHPDILPLVIAHAWRKEVPSLGGGGLKDFRKINATIAHSWQALRNQVMEKLRLGCHAAAFNQASAELLVAKNLILRWRQLAGATNEVAIQGTEEMIASQPPDKPWLTPAPLPDLRINPREAKPPLNDTIKNCRSIIYAMRGVARGAGAAASSMTVEKLDEDDEDFADETVWGDIPASRTAPAAGRHAAPSQTAQAGSMPSPGFEALRDEWVERFAQIEAERREDKAALKVMIAMLEEEKSVRKAAEARLAEEQAAALSEKAEMMALLRQIAGGFKG